MSNQPERRPKKATHQSAEFQIKSDQFPKEVSSALNKLTAPEQKTVISFIAKSHSGPLPSPETLEEYDRIIPDGGDRLMKQVENQQTHRHEIEKKSVDRSLNQSSTGQWIGGVLCVLVLIISWDLIRCGHDAAGATLAGIDLVALATVFVLRK